MTRLETALAWWPAFLRYGGLTLMVASFLLFVITAAQEGVDKAIVVPTPFLLTIGAMMAVGEGGKAIKDFANSPAPRVPQREQQ